MQRELLLLDIVTDILLNLLPFRLPVLPPGFVVSILVILDSQSIR